MPLPRASAEFYRSQQRITIEVVTGLRALWRRMGTDFDASWARIGPTATALVIAGQAATTRQVEPYVADVLDETGQTAELAATPVFARLLGAGSDGRPLGDLLRGSVITAKQAMATGATSNTALATGGRWLDMTAQSTLADTSRTATSVSIAARPNVGGYVRMVNTPACSRCVILAGRFYRWNTGFARHPRCDCAHIPASENVAGDLTTDPNVYFNSISPAEQGRIFGRAGAQVIRDGGDMSQVVNARSGMYTTADGQLATRTGTSKRALAGKRMQSAGLKDRLMPETILARAETRSEALTMLHQYGYVK